MIGSKRFNYVITQSLILSLLGLAFTLSSCGIDHQDETDGYTPAFIALWSPQTTSLQHAREPEFRVCIEGREHPNAREYIRRGMLTWLRALWVIDRQVSRKITFTCSQSHMRVRMRPGSGRSFASPKAANMFASAGYGTYLHEFGHSFAGLGDTYTGSAAGQCRAGQPQSNMCWGEYGPRRDPSRWSGLWRDDIEGIQSMYRRMFRDLHPPTHRDEVDLKRPITNLDNPWPSHNHVNPHADIEQQQNRIFVTIIEGRSRDELYVSMPSSVTNASYCFGGSEACSEPNARRPLSKITVSNTENRVFFKSTTALERDPTTTHNVHIFGSKGSERPELSRAIQLIRNGNI